MLQEKATTLRSLNIQARRRHIIEAARKLIATGGPPALWMRKLGAVTGLSVTTLYHLFGNSHGILSALIDDTFDRVDKALESEANREDPLEQRHAAIIVSFRCMIEDGAVYRPLGIARYERLARAGAEERRVSDRAAAIAAVSIERAITQGQLADQLDPHHFAQQMFITWDRSLCIGRLA